MIDEVDVWMILAYFLQQGLNKLGEVVNLLKLAAAVLIHPAVCRQDVQRLEQFNRLAGPDFDRILMGFVG